MRKLIVTAASVLLVSSVYCDQPISLQLGSEYFQNFDTLVINGTSNVLPEGWSLYEQGGDGYYTASSGTSRTGDTYSYGAIGSSERALGSLTSSSIPLIMFGVSFENTGSMPITALFLSYDGEQWREGTATQDYLKFEYSIGASSLTDPNSSWIEITALNFYPPNTGTERALDGNLDENKRALSAIISDIKIESGQTIWFRWSDRDVSGYDAGMAIDNFRVVALPEPSSYALLVSGLCLLYAIRKRLKK